MVYIFEEAHIHHNKDLAAALRKDFDTETLPEVLLLADKADRALEELRVLEKVKALTDRFPIYQ